MTPPSAAPGTAAGTTAITTAETGVLRLAAARPLTCADVEAVSRGDGSPRVAFAAEAIAAMHASRGALHEAVDAGEEVYGLTTGFGPLVQYAADSNACAQGTGLIAHLGAGWGPLASPEIVRATLLCRANTLAQGMSGINPAVAEGFLALLNHNVLPAIPEVGSVGASGDLIPLAHAARVLTGEGRVLSPGSATIDAADALAIAGMSPVDLPGRDALALVNGTSFMTAYAAIACARAERLLARAETLTGWLYRALGARLPALDDRLHAARGHVGQRVSAANIRREALAQGDVQDEGRPLQEVYSVRCAPQFLGAARDQLEHARALVERELNGVNDNPVVASGAVLHGGNFQGQQIAFASDTINTALVHAGIVAERQLDVLCNPDLNGGAPLLLASEPGATSGMAGAQITATAVIAEMRHHATPSAIASIPTNGRNQDVVSMGTLAARAALGQTDRLGAVLGVLAIALDQLAHLRNGGRAPGRVAARPAALPAYTPFDRDRALHSDLARISAGLLAP
ncbi:MAG: aromatic amino acid ammonia-lyase [Planctomycetota bacterium]